MSYVDPRAPTSRWRSEIVLNAKMRRTGVCGFCGKTLPGGIAAVRRLHLAPVDQSLARRPVAKCVGDEARRVRRCTRENLQTDQELARGISRCHHRGAKWSRTWDAGGSAHICPVYGSQHTELHRDR